MTDTHTPATEEPVGTRSVETAYDGRVGTFAAHGGTIPDPGTVVRGIALGSTRRQLEGVLISVDATAGTATIVAKRKRDRVSGASFGEWAPYTTTVRRQIKIDGAEVFTPEPKAALVRTTAICDEADQRAIPVGGILSALRSGGVQLREDYVYRGTVLTADLTGGASIRSTERALTRPDAVTGDEYAWEAIPERNVDVHCHWASGRLGRMDAGWLWEYSTTAAGSVPRPDPALDPDKKTPLTGMKIGDMVVGLRPAYGRDTVASWVKGTIVKWDLRNQNPIVRVTDPMESDAEVDSEVSVRDTDTYPALADPKNSDPEEFKKTLRNYLIGRHKRNDFCRGGLNTMLAAFGLPLYETRRRAKMVVTVDYDPNETDLYSVQSGLRSGLDGVEFLSFAERSGEDIELTVESDVSADD